jgi:hypothetical protein
MESQMERSLRSSFSPTPTQCTVAGERCGRRQTRPNEPARWCKALISQLVGLVTGDETGPNEGMRGVSWAWGSAEFGHDNTEATEKGKSHGATGRMWKPGHLARRVR